MLTPGKGPNRVFQKSVSGGSVESVFSAAHQNAVAQNVERVNRVVYGPGADVLSLGPYAVRRQQGGGGGDATFRHAVITRVCNAECATYEIEFVTRSFSEDCGGTDSGTGSGS